MSSKTDSSANAAAPFGSRRDLPKAPVCVLGLLYVGWLVMLIWMAVSETTG